MKKFLSATIIALVCACMLSAFTACNKPNNNPTDADNGYTVTLSQTSLALDLYDRVELTATVTDSDGNAADKDVVWSSSSNSILTVDGGLVFAKSLGSATVTAKVADDDASATVNVTVSMRGNVPALRLAEETSLALAVGGSFELAPRVVFKGAEATDADTVFTYAVSDDSVAKVENGTITALKAGTASITVTASWRGIGGPEMVGSEDALGLKITLNLTVKTVE